MTFTITPINLSRTVRFWAVLATVTFFSSNLFGQQPVAPTSGKFSYSLQECVDYALAYNLTLQNQRLSELDAFQQQREAKATGLPDISASFDYNDNFKIQQSFLPAQFLDPTAPEGTFTGVKFSPKYNSSANLIVRQMVFDAKYFIALKASRVYTELSRREVQRTEIETISNVSKAYYTAQVSEVNQGVAEANIERLKKQKKDTEVQYGAGLAEKVDVDRVQVLLNNATTQLENAVALTELSISQLKYQMGMKQGYVLELSEKITPESRPDFTEDLAKSFDYTQRIEYRVLQSNLDLTAYDIKNYQTGYYPSLYATGTYGFGTQSQDFGDLWRSSSPNKTSYGFGVFGLSLSVPIWNGGRTSAQVQRSKISYNKLENQLIDTENQLSLDYANAKTILTNAVRTLQTQEQNVKLAEEVLRVQQVRYREGIGSNLEVVDAESSLKEAQNNYLGSLLDAYLAQVDLKKSLGLLTPGN